MMQQDAIRLDRVHKCFGRTTALDDISLQIRPGEFVGLLGASGAGKSTLFRCLTALEQPDSGSVSVFGRDISRLRAADLRDARRDIGLIFQQFNLIGRMSAIDNVLAGRLGHTSTWRVVVRKFTAADRQLALESLDRVGMLERAYQRADSLSGGQQQRVAIARVLTQRSRIVLADEPVASLDPESADTVLGTLRRIAQETGIAVLCSLHQVELARAYADRIIGLRHGKVVIDKPPAELEPEMLTALYRRDAVISPNPLPPVTQIKAEASVTPA